MDLSKKQGNLIAVIAAARLVETPCPDSASDGSFQ